MALSKEAKSEIVSQFGKNTTDTGRTHTQVALLTRRIESLTQHFKAHKHDNGSRRGLLKLVGQRRRLLKYLSKTDLEGYRKLIAQLGLRK